MTMIRKRHSTGWYGSCKKCTDLELGDVDFRYKIESIHKVNPETDGGFMKWKPATRRVENDYGGGYDYDNVHNKNFNKLECGSTYVISNPKENVIHIPNYVEVGGDLTYDCECIDTTPPPTVN